MLQQDAPEDYVIATGETNTVRRCVEIAFDQVGLDWEKYVVIDDALKRPAEVDLLVGDASKAERELGWEPHDELRGADPADGRRGPRPALALSGRVAGSRGARGVRIDSAIRHAAARPSRRATERRPMLIRWAPWEQVAGDGAASRDGARALAAQPLRRAAGERPVAGPVDRGRGLRAARAAPGRCWTATSRSRASRWSFGLVGGSFAACGLVAWRAAPDSRSGALMTATGFAFFIYPLLSQIDAPLAATLGRCSSTSGASSS